MKQRAALACLLLSSVLVLPAAAAEPLPTITLTSLTIKRSEARDGFAGTVSIRFRMCLNAGPRAAIITRETRKVGATTKARRTSLEPLGVDLDDVYAYDCAANQSVAWAVPSRLFLGGGTYSADVRVRDGYGRLSAPVLFSIRL